MRQIIIAFLMASVFILSAAASIICFITAATDFFQGKEYFNSLTVSLVSGIFAMTFLIGFIVLKVLTNTEILADVLTKYLQHQLSKTNSSGSRPDVGNILSSLFGGGVNNNPNFNGSISVKAFDIDGNQISLGKENFESTADFIKHRDELLAKAFGYKPEHIKKKLEDMTIEELESEEKKAVKSQQFELAAAVRDLIQEKKDKGN